MQRHGGIAAAVANAMYVRSREVEGRAGGERPCLWLAADRQALLADVAADDGHGAGRDVVVVKAGVLLVHPADQPRGHVRVAEQLVVDALSRVVPDELDPQLRSVGELAHERLQLRGGQVALARARQQVERDRRRRARRRGEAHRDTTLSRPRSRRRLAERLERGQLDGVPIELADDRVLAGVGDWTVRAIQQLVGADDLGEAARGAGPIRGGLVEDQRVRAAAPPARRASAAARPAAAPGRRASRRRRAGVDARPARRTRTPTRRRACRTRSASTPTTTAGPTASAPARSSRRRRRRGPARGERAAARRHARDAPARAAVAPAARRPRGRRREARYRRIRARARRRRRRGRRGRAPARPTPRSDSGSASAPSW